MSMTPSLTNHRLALFGLFTLLLGFCVPFPSFAKDPATIVRVVDGDTIEVILNGQKEKIRLIGVDTPEKFESDKLHRDAARTGQDEKTIRALGERASDFTKSLVKRGDAL
jgi:micrococcal nuclease